MGEGLSKSAEHKHKALPNSASSPNFGAEVNYDVNLTTSSPNTPLPSKKKEGKNKKETKNAKGVSLPTSKSFTFKPDLVKPKKPKSEQVSVRVRAQSSSPAPVIAIAPIISVNNNNNYNNNNNNYNNNNANSSPSEVTRKKKKSRSFHKKLMIFDSGDKIMKTPSPTLQNPHFSDEISLAFTLSLNEERRTEILKKSEEALSSDPLTGTQNIMHQVMYLNPLQNSTRNLDRKTIKKHKSRSDDVTSDPQKQERISELVESIESRGAGGYLQSKPVNDGEKVNLSSSEGAGYLPNKRPSGSGYLLSKPNSDSNFVGGYLQNKPQLSSGGGYLSVKPHSDSNLLNGGGYISHQTANNNNNNNNNINNNECEENGSDDDSQNSKRSISSKDWSGFGDSSSDDELVTKNDDNQDEKSDKKINNNDNEDNKKQDEKINILSNLFTYINSVSPEDLNQLGKEILSKYPNFANDLNEIVEDFKAEKMLIEGDGNDDDDDFGGFSDDSDESSYENDENNKFGGEGEDIDHLLDVSCNWNQRFQVCIEMLKHHGQIHEKRVQIFLHLSNLAQDFIHCAKTYGRIIISEAETPIDSKTIKPTKIGGFAGGDKYIVNNIMFKFAVDSHNLFDVEEAAIKIAGHDLKGLISYFNLGIEGLHFPLMALVDYLGYRLIAMSVLPIGKDSIVYGSSDAGRSIHNSCPTLSYKMGIAAELLNLKKHKVGKNENEMVEMYSAADLEGHDVDGVFYLLDFSRSFPPTAYDQRYRNSYLYRLFRSEFVKNYKPPLCPDTYSGFAVDSAETHIAEVEQATRYLIHTTIPKFADSLNHMGDKAVSSLNLKEALHEAGINLRYLGNLRHNAKREDIKQLILVEMIARIIKHELRSKMRQQMRELKLPLEHSCREMVIAHLNLIFGKSPESEEHFNTSIKEHLLRNFEEALSQHETSSSLKTLLSGKDKCLLFRLVQQMTSLNFTSSAQMEFSNNENAFEFENPFYVTDLEEIGVRVRHLNIVALAQGYVLKNQARKLDGKNSERLCKLALEKFKQALSDNPGDIRALRELADASNILGDKESADMYYKRATKISNDPNTLFKYAVFLEENQKFREAEEYYLLTLEKDYKHDHCLQRYGHFLENQGNPDSAEKFFIRASEVRSRSHNRQPSANNNNWTTNFIF